jgi:nucleotide-binding universal stress UspA family protein
MVLVAYDGSAASERAVEAAVDFARGAPTSLM